MIFSLFINLVYYINWFLTVKPTLHFGIILTWSRWNILYPYCWIQYANILLRISMSVFMKDIGVWYSFFEKSFSFFFLTRVMLALENGQGIVSSLFSRWVCVTLVLFPTSVFNRIYHWNSIPLTDTGLLRHLISSYVSFGNFVFSRKFVHFKQVVEFILTILFIIVPYCPDNNLQYLFNSDTDNLFSLSLVLRVYQIY